MVAHPRVPDDVFAAVREHLTDREIVEALQVTGFYWSFGRVCTVLDVETEAAHRTAVVATSQRMHQDTTRTGRSGPPRSD